MTHRDGPPRNRLAVLTRTYHQPQKCRPYDYLLQHVREGEITKFAVKIPGSRRSLSRQSATTNSLGLPSMLCMHSAPKSSASSLPSPHDARGTGGSKRSFSTGGSANGIPRNPLTPPGNILPTTWPSLVATDTRPANRPCAVGFCIGAAGEVEERIGGRPL